MKKLQRLLTSIIACTLLFCFCLTGCGEQEDKKYDVTIKITNNFGSEWIFTPDVSELTYEFEFTGEEMYFYVDSYNLPEHPQWSKKWFAPSGEGADTFDASYGKVNQRYDEEDPICICERGEYFFYVRANDTSDLWNARTIRLYITVI